MSKNNVFTNIGSSIGAVSGLIVSAVNVVEVNLESLEQLSIAGSIKAEDIAGGAQLRSDNFRAKLEMKNKMAKVKRERILKTFEETGELPEKKKKENKGKRRARLQFN